jgi:hypothetical protein
VPTKLASLSQFTGLNWGEGVAADAPGAPHRHQSIALLIALFIDAYAHDYFA